MFSFNVNPGTTHYIDNLVVVPEPGQTVAVMGLVALLGILYMRRRNSAKK